MKQLKFAQIFTAALMSAGIAGAQPADFGGLPSMAELKTRAAALAVPAPAAAAAVQRGVKEWTIMVLANGKNSLSKYVETDINEMETVGSNDNINIVVEAGKKQYAPPADDYEDLDGGNPWGGIVPGNHPVPPMYKEAVSTWDNGVRRYYVTKDSNAYLLTSKMVQELPATDMGDWNHLVDFVNWARTNYPAKKYMLIVWNHGDGWRNKGIALPLTRGISYDDVTGNHISAVQLGQALAKMGGVDVYASDACLMQMAEVVYELRNSAQFIVGSEETEPGDGWDYNAFLTRMTASALTPEAVAKAAVEGYSASYAAKKQSVTLSAVRTAGAENLRAQLDAWAALALKQDKAKLAEALNAATAFEGADSKDLAHFMTLAGEKVPALKAKGAEVTAALAAMLVKNGATGEKFKNAGGLGIYLPSYSFDASYSKLAMSKAGGWDEFMQWMKAK